LRNKFSQLNNAINKLSADDAQIITLFYKAEQSLEEIGVVLGVDHNTVKVRLHRARQRLKEKLQKYLKHDVQMMQKE
jgi:RNA polymerase sigma-70 factor (ECF subfamily)